MKNERKDTAYVGVVISLSAWAMFDAALFFAYGYLRLDMPGGSWPHLPRLLPLLNVVCLLLGGSALRYVQRTAQDQPMQRRMLRRSARFASALGGVFIIFVGCMWKDLRASHSDAIYLLTGFHAFNVAVAAGGLFIRSFSASIETVQRWALFWDCVTASWGVVFISLFLF